MNTANKVSHTPLGGVARDAIRCRYDDCRHPVASDDEQVTCPECRSDLGLPPMEAQVAPGMNSRDAGEPREIGRDSLPLGPAQTDEVVR